MDTAADAFSIMTGVVVMVGLFIGGYELFWKAREQRKALENHLRNEMKVGKDKGQRSMLHLMRHLKMTEDEIFHAARRSRHITLAVGASEVTGLAEILLFQYWENGHDEN